MQVRIGSSVGLRVPPDHVRGVVHVQARLRKEFCKVLALGQGVVRVEPVSNLSGRNLQIFSVFRGVELLALASRRKPAFSR